VALLERDGELDALERVVETGGILVIEGGAGIGKTSLLGAACERAKGSGREVLRARGSELESGFAFGVVRQLFERLASAADRDERRAMFAGPAASVQPLLFGQTGGAPATDTSFAVLHGLYWLAANIAARRPLVIAVDDAHWADSASLRWLAYLAPRLEGLALSLLVALRPAEPESEGASLLAVRAASAVVRPRVLGQSAAAAVARERLGAAANDALCASFWRASGGNPFYLQELLRAVDLGDSPSDQLDPSELVALGAEGVRRQVAGRLRHLDPRTLELAQALAVLGDGCELRRAAALADFDMDVASSLAAALVRLEVLGESSRRPFYIRLFARRSRRPWEATVGTRPIAPLPACSMPTMRRPVWSPRISCTFGLPATHGCSRVCARLRMRRSRVGRRWPAPSCFGAR
jgi:predicted ATPase